MIMKKNNKIFHLLLIIFSIFLLVGCGKIKEEEKETISKTIVVTDFVTYDVTRNLIKDTDLSVEYINVEEELSGRDRNKINNSLIFINTKKEIENIDENVNTINIFDNFDIKINEKEDNEIYNDNFSINTSENQTIEEEKDKNQQIIINKNNKKEDVTENNENNNDNNDNNNNSNNTTTQEEKIETENNLQNNENNPQKEETTNNGIYFKPMVRAEFVKSSFSGSQPCSSDNNGYSLGNFPDRYNIIQGKDEYQNYLISRLEGIGAVCGANGNSGDYFALSNNNGTYTIFQNTSLSGKTFRVVYLDRIDGVGMDTIIYCEESIKDMIASINYSQTKKIALANTVDESYKGIWLDVKNVKKLSEIIKEEIIKKCPEHKEIVENNFNTFSEELLSLNEKMEYIVKESENKTIFIGGAFVYKYLTDGYGIKYISIYDYSNQDESPSLTRLSNYAKILNSYNIKYIIKDEESSSDGIDSVKSELNYNTNIVIINTMDNIEDMENNTYLDIMNNNSVILKKSIY